MMKRFLWLVVFIVAGLLAACGGGGSDGTTSGTTNDSAITTGITSGVAVDPYIVNAHFDELSADRQSVIQSTSSPSDANGAFAFDNALTDGSIIQIKNTEKGQHANAPYEGVIKRQVFAGDSEPVVVSPLTTLLANGMAPSAVVQMLQSAGFGGLSVNDLYTDPMAGLMNRTGNVTDADLVLLQANMAVNTFMVANQDFNYGDAATAAPHPVAFNDIAKVVKKNLNPIIYQELVGTLGTGFTVGDLAKTAAIMNRNVARRIKEQVAAGSVTVPTTTIDQIATDALADAPTIAGSFYTGGTTAPPATGTPDAQAIFTADCAGCHNIGTTTNVYNLAGDGAKVSGKFGNGISHYQGLTLTAEEITAMAVYLDSQTGTTDPGTGTTDPGTGTGGGSTPALTGEELYARDCQSCHSTLAASNINDRTATGIQNAITSVSMMSSINLSSTEIQLISDALTGSASTPPATTDPGTGTGGGSTPALTGEELYARDCQSCHGNLAASNINDRTAAGIQNAITSVSMMGSINLSSTEIQSISDALSGLASTPPATTDPGTGGGSTPTPTCGSCHSLPPSGTDGFQAGAHAVHTALASIGTDITGCANCHTDSSAATHIDGWVDVVFSGGTWDAQSGPASISNTDDTCSNIICHGGQQTPSWTTGSINVESDCRSCHTSSGQYNSNASGQHRRHSGRNCTDCHDFNKLQVNHFGDLTTSAFEQDPANTLGNRITGYNGSTCTNSCHGSENW